MIKRLWKRRKIVVSAPPPVAREQLVTEILSELAHFCRAFETCFHADPRIHAALEGRREVWLRIRELWLDRPETEDDIRRRFLETIRSGVDDGQ